MPPTNPQQKSSSNSAKPSTSTQLAPEQDRTIHIANLSPSVSKRALYLDFIQFGKITNLRIAGKEEYSTRFAFVEFEQVDDALRAMEAMQGSVFDGKRISISRAKSKIHTPFDVESLDLEGKKTPLEGPSYRFHPRAPLTNAPPLGTPPSVIVPHPQQSILTPQQHSGTGLASGTTPNTPTPSQQQQQGDASRTIYIANIDITLPDESLINFFHSNNIGYVTNHRICRVKDKAKSKRPQQTKFAFVEFATREQAQKAVSYSGQMIGKFAVNISHSKTAIYAPPSGNGGGSGGGMVNGSGNSIASNALLLSAPLNNHNMAHSQQQGGVNIPSLSTSNVPQPQQGNLYGAPSLQQPSLLGGGMPSKDPRLAGNGSAPLGGGLNDVSAGNQSAYGTYDHTNYYFGSPQQQNGGTADYGGSYGGYGYGGQSQNNTTAGLYGSNQPLGGYGYGGQSLGGSGYGTPSLPTPNVWSQNYYGSGGNSGNTGYGSYGAWGVGQQQNGGGFGNTGNYYPPSNSSSTSPVPLLSGNALPNGGGVLPAIGAAGKRKRPDEVDEEAARVAHVKRSRPTDTVASSSHQHQQQQQVWRQGFY